MATQVTATLPARFGKSGHGNSPTAASGSTAGNVATDHISEFTASAGVAVDHLLTAAAGVTVNGAALTANAGATLSAATVTGAITATGGIVVPGAAPSVFHSGGVGVAAAATGTDSTAVNTETYIVEIVIPFNCTLTGISWLGLATSTGNVQFSLADSAGTVIAAAQTASTATTGTANFQLAAFAVAYAAKAGKYFILMQNSGSNHYRSHVVGNFGASKKTGETFGTFTNVTAPTTFTTNLGPICDTY